MNKRSFITVRLLSHSPVKIDQDFFRKRIISALKKRRIFEGGFRLVHSEADGLPGLVADVYGEYLVIQFNTLGMEKMKSFVLNAVDEILKPKGIFEKSEGRARIREGLKESRGWVKGKGEELIPFIIDDVKYFSDTKGQKTGFFLDQRSNAQELRKFSKGDVLDAFCYSGAFSVNALKGGATHVIALDRSERAIEIAQKTLNENGFLGKYELKVDNAFDALKSFERKGQVFDMVILDPPGFAKGKKEVKSALRGYKEINLRAMKILKNGGYLATASCSAALSRELFLKMIEDAAKDAHRRLRVAYFGVQSYDHPILIGMKESEYLKFFIFEVEAIL